MKPTGKAARAVLKLASLVLVLLLAVLAAAFLFLNQIVSLFILECCALGLVSLWALFALFVLYFFRDPNPRTPEGKDLVVAPAHGKVDVIDETAEPDFLGGPCRRISIFLSVFDVHVQNAPVAGKISFFKHTPGQYLNAMKTDSARFNENVLLGLDCAEPPGEKIGVRLIAGLIARRIVPWVQLNDAVRRGERLGLIQFGSRVDIYLPPRAKLKIALGDKVIGGETVIASFD